MRIAATATRALSSVSSTRTSRRRALLLLAGASTGAALMGPVARRAQAGSYGGAQPSTLTADLRIFESSTVHNRYPDDCDMRLDRLYIAEDLELSIEVQFNRALSDLESQQVQWLVSNEAEVWSMGDFAGQPNPALIATTLTTGGRDASTEAMVHVVFEGFDIAPPAPLRVVSNEEYNAAYATLASFTAIGGSPRSQLPLTADLLSRFLGIDSFDAGTPSVGTAQLNICDPRLTQRAGAGWGADAVAEVPLVQYAADQPASTIVAEAAARALLAQNADDIRQFFVEHAREQSFAANYTHNGNLTLTRPLDANFALHGVQFDGSVTASIDAPTQQNGPLTAQNVEVVGTLGDLYDFNIGASGAGAFPATEAAKIQIASVKHPIGKVFLVSFDLNASFDSLDV